MTDRASALATLREPNFRFYFLSRLVNGAGSTMGGIALAFAVLEVSHSPSALGTVLAAHSIPMVAFLLAGGVIADRFGRTLVIQVCNVLAGVTQLAMAGLVITGSAEIWHLVVLTAVNGVAASVSFPALASLMPQLVPREQLQPANVLMSMQRGIVAVLGPTTGGVLVVTVGAGWALAIDGVTYLVAAAILVPGQDPAAAAQGGAHLDGRGPPRRVALLQKHDLAVGRRAGLLRAQRPAQRRDLHARPRARQGASIGETGWGLGLSAEAAGLLLLPLVMIRVRLERPLLWGMAGCAFFGLPMLALGLQPQSRPLVVAFFVAGDGRWSSSGSAGTSRCRSTCPTRCCPAPTPTTRSARSSPSRSGSCSRVPSPPVRHPGDDPGSGDRLRRGVRGHAGVALGARPPARGPRRHGYVTVMSAPRLTSFQSSLANAAGSMMWLAVTQSIRSWRISTCWL